MAKHTPGPWKVSGGRGSTEVVGKGGVMVADLEWVPDTLRGRPDDAAELLRANARLIAAAPELKVALERYETVYAEWAALALPQAVNTPAFEMVQQIVHDARALLARIEGGGK